VGSVEEVRVDAGELERDRLIGAVGGDDLEDCAAARVRERVLVRRVGVRSGRAATPARSIAVTGMAMRDIRLFLRNQVTVTVASPATRPKR
jgi:hypothetical protein